MLVVIILKTLQASGRVGVRLPEIKPYHAIHPLLKGLCSSLSPAVPRIKLEIKSYAPSPSILSAQVQSQLILVRYNIWKAEIQLEMPKFFGVRVV